jgi:hypothetical protein
MNRVGKGAALAIPADAGATTPPIGWPRRFTLVLFFFTCALILYIDRVNISVVAPILMTEFGWDPAVTGTILSAFFVGYFLTQLGSGVQVLLASKRLICNYYMQNTPRSRFLGATGSLLPVLSRCTGGQAASGTQTDGVKIESISCRSVSIDDHGFLQDVLGRALPG